MTPLLAEVSIAEKWMVGCTIIMALASIGALIVAVVAVNKKQMVRVEQPLEVQFANEFVHQQDFERHEEANERAFTELRKEREEDRIRGEASRSKIYEKLESMNRDMNSLSSKMGDMGGKIVAEILNAKKI